MALTHMSCQNGRKLSGKDIGSEVDSAPMHVEYNDEITMQAGEMVIPRNEKSVFNRHYACNCHTNPIISRTSTYATKL